MLRGFAFQERFVGGVVQPKRPPDVVEILDRKNWKEPITLELSRGVDGHELAEIFQFRSNKATCGSIKR